MHDGFKVVAFDYGDAGESHFQGGKVLKRFDDHESLAYGVDWSFAPSEENDTPIASSSFYDHVLHTWGG